MPTEPSDQSVHPPGIRRWVMATLGTISLVLAIIGIILPVMPTTPFLLISAACYLRSSRKLYDWMHSNRIFGGYLRRYHDGRGIPLWMKVGTLGSMWTTMLVSCFLFVPGHLWWVRVLVFACGAGVTVHIIRIKTARRGPHNAPTQPDPARTDPARTDPARTDTAHPDAR